MSDLFDPETGEIKGGGLAVDDCGKCLTLEAVLESTKTDLNLAEKELASKRRQIGRLEKELRDARHQSPLREKAQEVFDLWIELTGRSPKRVKFGDKREKAVLARLNEGRDLQYLLTAVRGLQIGATTSDAETQRQVLMAVMQAAMDLVDEAEADGLRAMYRKGMKGVQVYDDLELLCRNEVNLERFHGIAERTLGEDLSKS